MKLHSFLVFALAAGCGACASTGATPRPFPGPLTRTAPATPEPPESSNLPAIDRDALVGTALELRGVPYKNGGTDQSGFDCSGLTQFVFRQWGVSLPRDVQAQYQSGEPVRRDEIAPGDLIFFATTGRRASHVAIVVGDGQFVHAPSSKGVVRVERLSATYWSTRFIGARRVVPINRSN